MVVARFIFAFLAVITFGAFADSVLAKSHEELPSLTFTGTAYSVGQSSRIDSIIYTEHHSIYQNPEGEYLRSKVEYRNPQGELIATKDLNFSDYQTLPELSFYDLRTSSVFETKYQIEERAATVQLVSQQESSLKNSQVEISKLNRSVVDAGFDLFVLKHWDALLKGKKVKLDFLALTRASFYTFRLEKEHLSDNEIVISLKPAAFLLKLVVEPIILTYDLTSKRLLRFEGLTNIEKVIKGKAKGENYIARIEYDYSNEPQVEQ